MKICNFLILDASKKTALQISMKHVKNKYVKRCLRSCKNVILTPKNPTPQLFLL